MAKASDPRLADITKKRPSSAPKPGEIIDIPKIILEDRKETPPLFPSSLSTSVYSGAFSAAGMGGESRGIERRDIGLPAASMPNLAVSLSGSDMAFSENYLEVFCSPRTFRRSVDLDNSAKENACGHFEWVDNTDSSSSLKVLTSSSRVGSALSLNSECTARSIGLLSNDSDSENDLSLAESDKLSNKPSHLKRFMSYPEDGASCDNYARPSQSMTDLKTMDSTTVKSEHGSDVPSDTAEVTDKSDSIIGTCESESAHFAAVADDRPSSPRDPNFQEKKLRPIKKDICRDRSKGVRPSHMLSYKCDTHDSVRDGRIRQWLQDMDSKD